MASALAGCAPEMKLVPSASPGVGVRFSQGKAMMVSAGDAGAIALYPLAYNGDSRQLLLVVAGYNHTGAPRNFGPENVSISLDSGATLAVHDFDTLRHDAKVEAKWEQAVSTAIGVADLYAANRAGRRDPHLSRELTSEAVDRYDDRSLSIAERLERHLEQAHQVLQTTTVDPQTFWGGLIVADQPLLATGEVRRMTVNVTFAGETHHFALYLAPEGTPTPREADLPAVTRIDGEKLLYGTPATWLWDVPPALPKPAETSWSVSRF
jgi:hypothetical protein